MNRGRKIIFAAFICAIVLVSGLYLKQGDLGTRVINVGNKGYYQDDSGELWEDKKNHDEYDETSYYIAPDGSYWTNEYRYLQSQR